MQFVRLTIILSKILNKIDDNSLREIILVLMLINNVKLMLHITFFEYFNLLKNYYPLVEIKTVLSKINVIIGKN